MKKGMFSTRRIIKSGEVSVERGGGGVFSLIQEPVMPLLPVIVTPNFPLITPESSCDRKNSVDAEARKIEVNEDDG